MVLKLLLCMVGFSYWLLMLNLMMMRLGDLFSIWVCRCCILVVELVLLRLVLMSLIWGLRECVSSVV